MLTNPSTLGLFDENIEEIERIFHGAGALMYYDGANLNAVCGISRPGDMGFDVVTSTCTRRSRSRTAAGPGGGRSRSRAARAVPAGAGGDPPRRRAASGSSSTAEVDRQGCAVHRAVRRLRPLLRLHPRVRAELREMSEGGRPERELPARAAEGAYDLPSTGCACTSSSLGATLKKEHGVTALDVAKRLMDYGFHRRRSTSR
jgi:glycine dehydrogenase subunit 2